MPGLLVLLGADHSTRRPLPFDQRVKVQEAIERVYYSHQEGATKAFEQAVPRAVLEKKVRTYLKQSILLEELWHSPVTAEALHRELERIARETRYPDRLREIYAALRHDPFVIEETFARAALVDRLARNLFHFDERIHLAARRQAESLRDQLLTRAIEPRAADPRRSESRVVLGERPGIPGAEPATGRPHSRPGGPRAPQHRADLLEITSRRTHAPPEVGEVGPVMEERDVFVIQVVLSVEAGSATMASYTIPKTSWDEWFNDAGSSLREDDFKPVAGGAEPLPAGARLAEFGTIQGAAACVPDDTWDNGILDDPPDPRVGHAAVWTGREMIVWGPDNSGSRYDPLTDTWRSVSQRNAPSGDMAVWTGQEMIVWDSFSGGPGGRYDPDADAWTPMPSFSPGAGEAVWTGREIIVWGNRSGSRYDPVGEVLRPISTVGAPGAGVIVWTGSEMLVWDRERVRGGRYDPATDTWSPMSTVNAPIGFGYYEAVWTGAHMVVVRGNNNTTTVRGNGGRYDPATDTWTPVAPVTSTYFSVIWTGREVLVWGGHVGFGVNTAVGSRYKPEADSWRLILGSPAAPRAAHTAVWTGREMIVWGGINARGDIFSTGGRYDPETDAWKTTSTTQGGPPGVTAAFWTGSFMLAWGSTQGGLYDPVTDSWKTVSSSGEPTGLEEAVWTGQELIVWGGVHIGTGTGVRQKVSRYDPFADAWRPVSITGAPPPLRDPVSVWTGREMIVWGWACPGTLCRVDGGPQGGRYDPAADTWTAMSTEHAPSDFFRQPVAAVWTGQEMIAWGADPTRYGPQADRWELVSTVGAPPPVFDLVWTGDEMVVFDIGCKFCIAAFRYDPVQDAWTQAPSGQSASLLNSSTAVWTGREAIVWGEAGGVRYDPITNSWSLMSRIDEPSPRFDHAVVWTGRGMIIWGGQAYYYNRYQVASGGRYFPGPPPDDDLDGFTGCSGDCNDADSGINPSAVELPGNMVDENCDDALECSPCSPWRNHAEYVRCVARSVRAMQRSGILSQDTGTGLISSAARSGVGRKKDAGQVCVP